MEECIIENHQKEKNFKGNYFLFCLSRVISDIGTSVFNFALSLYILDITGSVGLFSTILALTTIPSILVNIFGGVLVDRGNKKDIVVLSDILSGVVLGIFAIVLLFNPDDIRIFAVFVILLGTLQAVFSMALTASIPNIATEEDVPRLNATFQGLGAMMRIAGPIIGAIIYKSVGIQMVLIIDALSFIISGMLEMLLKYHTNISKESKNKRYTEQFKEVYKYVNSKTGLKLLFVVTLISSMVFSSLIMVVLPFITRSKLALTEIQVSVIMATAYIGMIIGMVIISTTKKSTAFFNKILLFFKLELAISIIWVFPLLFFTENPSKWLITSIYCVSMVLIGISAGFVNIPALSYIQTSTPEEIRASIIGVVNSLSLIATPLGFWLYGIMLANINWGYVVTIPTLILIAIITIIGRNKGLKSFFDTTSKN